MAPTLDAMCLFPHLLSAFRRAYRATKHAQQAKIYLFHLERELFDLQRDLRTGCYWPGAYHTFEIHDPKRRTISVAPFRDRVVHHALVGLLEPHYEKRFIYDSYASRKGKGTHKAVERAREWIRKEGWFMKTDIQKYFDSIDHSILERMLREKVEDERLMEVIQRIIHSGGNGAKGLPIGNLTSQFFANVYLDPFDHFIKDQMGIKGYIRYMDDMLFFSNDRRQLIQWKDRIEQTLHEKLALTLKPGSIHIAKCIEGCPFLGRRIYPGVIRMQRPHLMRSLRRLKSREKAFEEGRLEEERWKQSATSILGHIGSANTYRLRRSVFGTG